MNAGRPPTLRKVTNWLLDCCARLANALPRHPLGARSMIPRDTTSLFQKRLSRTGWLMREVPKVAEESEKAEEVDSSTI